MFSLLDMRLVLCSFYFDVVRAQRIIGFFILITHKSTRAENSITWYGPSADFYGRFACIKRTVTPKVYY